jgi:hypothetical protein
VKRIALALAIAGCGSKPEPGVLSVSDDDGEWRMTGREVAFKDLPLGDIGLPFTGGKVDIDLRVPVANGKRDYARANGFVAMTCPAGCQIGDDKAKLVPTSSRNHAFAGQGIEFGHIAFERVDIRLEIGDGHVKIARWIVSSNDMSIDLEGDVTLATDLEQSRIEACLRFKPTDALLKRDPKSYYAMALTGASPDAQGDFSIRFTDRLGSAKKFAAPCGPGAVRPITRPTLP